MKVLLTLATALMTTMAFAHEATYCRKVETGGMFGQPKGVGEHCITLESDNLFFFGKLTDNANTFFGNPPETLFYLLDFSKIKNGAVTIETQSTAKEVRESYSYNPIQNVVIYNDQVMTLKK